MNFQFLKSSTPFIQLIFMVFLMLAGFLIFSFLGFLIAMPLFHVNLFDLTSVMNNMENPANIRILKYLQFIQSVSLFVIPPFIFILLTGEKVSQYFGFKIKAGHLAYLFVIIIMLSLIPVNNFLANWNSQIRLPNALTGLEKTLRDMEQSADNLTRIFLKMDNTGAYMVNLVIIAVIPAIGEELSFRGVFQPLFIRWTRNVHVGIFLTGFFFSFFHFQFFGFFPRWLLGVLFGYIFYWSRTIWLPVFAHFLNNGIAVTAYWLYGSETVEKKIDTFGTSLQDMALYTGIILVVILMFAFYTDQKNRESHIPPDHPALS